MKALTWEAWSSAIEKLTEPPIPAGCFTVKELAVKWNIKPAGAQVRRKIRSLVAKGWLELVKIPGVRLNYYRLVVHD